MKDTLPMMKIIRPLTLTLLVLTAFLSSFSVTLATEVPHRIDSQLINTSGKIRGQATLEQLPQGTLLTVQLKRMMPGWHAIHLHSIGQCSLPDFKSAGGHFNPGKAHHGFEDTQGHHQGDLPNIYVGHSGQYRGEFLLPGVSLRDTETPLIDTDGAALVVHEDRDDYTSQPAGNAGNRILCGVLK
jgi:superoxide dismutase, Cu-Zn family